MKARISAADAAAVRSRLKAEAKTEDARGGKQAGGAHGVTRPTQSAFLLLPSALLVPSPTNPRKDFSEAALAELAESVKVHGVLQPLLVRVLATPKRSLATHGRDARATNCYEIVCGERRWRAAKIAGLQEVPVTIRDLDDRQVVELQLIENLQRADLNALEEAQGYQDLVRHGMRPEEIAARIGKKGKSRSYVYCRLKLLNLCPAGREALLAGKIQAEVGLLIARIPDEKLQERALRDVGPSAIYGDGMSFREAQAYIKRECMLKLSEAPWPLADAVLIPKAGPCSACPKRSGNQKEVFSDIGSTDVCTDPACYALKKSAWAERTLAEAVSKNGKSAVLAPEITKKVFWDHGGLRSDDWVDLQDRCDLLGHAHSENWQQTLGKKCPAPTLAVDPQGNVHKLLRREEARAALKAAGLKPQENGTDDVGSADWRSKERERLAARKRARATALEVVPAILAKLAPALLNPHHAAHRRLWELLARSAYDRGSIDEHAFIAQRRGLAKVQTEAREVLNKFFAVSLASDAAREYVLEGLLGANWSASSYDAKFSVVWLELAELAGVNVADRAAVEKRQRTAAVQDVGALAPSVGSNQGCD